MADLPELKKRFFITPREDHSRHYDQIRYDRLTPFITMAILRGDCYDNLIYVNRRQFGALMRRRDWDGIYLTSERSLKYVLKYGAKVNKDHPLYEQTIKTAKETQE